MRRQRGFTLLEMLVATTIMGIAVVALLANLSTSMRNGARLSDYDRAAVLARAKMDELLLDRNLPLFAALAGTFEPAVTGGAEAGWKARVTPFEMLPGARQGSLVLERLELEVWWGPGEHKRTLTLEGYRQAILPAGGAAETP
ncbi:MAG: type IV pilus modification PilV family protein [Acidobacteriota bacterium]